MIHLGDVAAGSTLYIPFATYNAAGASVTQTGFAVTDIEIYKNGSITQRASDAGYTLLDTDGIDFDALTGIHGFSVNLADNTDASFFAVGSFYWVIVSSVTIDSQTVNFIAATFRIVAAENTAGYPTVTIKDGTGVGEIDTTSGGVLVSGGTIASVSGSVGSVTGAVGSVTGSVGSVATNGISAASLAADAGAEIADAILDRDMSLGTDSGSTSVRTARQALRFLRNKWSIAAGTLTVTKENDTTASWTAAVTGTTGADPITTVDPA